MIPRARKETCDDCQPYRDTFEGIDGQLHRRGLQLEWPSRCAWLNPDFRVAGNAK